MNKVLRGFLTYICITIVITFSMLVILCNAVRSTVTKENLQKCVASMNIEDVLSEAGTSYSQVLKDYSSQTGISEEDIDKILSSSDYSNIVGGYMIDEEMLDFDLSSILSGTDLGGTEDIKELEGLGGEQSEAATKEQLKALLDDMGIEYSENDVTYFEKNIAEKVAPDIQSQIEETMGNPTSFFSINGILNTVNKIFSKDIITIGCIIVIIGLVGLAILRRHYYIFLIHYTICSVVLCLLSRVFYALVHNLSKNMPTAFKPMITTFSLPLEQSFLSDFNVLLIATIVFILLYFILNVSFNHSSIGDTLNIFGKRQHKSEDYLTLNEMYNGKLADELDISELADSIDDDYDRDRSEEIDFYNRNLPKDITFSQDTYVHRESGE